MQPKPTGLFKLALLTVAVAIFLWWIFPRPSTPSSGEASVSVGTSTVRLLTFPDTPIEAQSAYVYDMRTGKALFQKDALTPRPLASITKLMSALVASRVMPKYELVRIGAQDIRQDGDTGLFVGETWRISDLLDFTLIESSNDGIHAIAEAAGSDISATSSDPVALFADEMNATASSLGFQSMRFLNESGLDLSPLVSGGYGSAKDVALLVDYILKHDPHLIEATARPSMTISSEDHAHNAVNTDLALVGIPNVVASKTGYTDLADGNVVAAFNAGLDHPIVIAVLGSSYDGRFADLRALASSTVAYLAQKAESPNQTIKYGLK